MFAKNIFSPLGNSIVQCHKFQVLLLDHYQVVGLSNLLKTNSEKGIHGDDADLLKRRNSFGSNNYPRKKGRGFLVMTYSE